MKGRVLIALAVALIMVMRVEAKSDEKSSRRVNATTGATAQSSSSKEKSSKKESSGEISDEEQGESVNGALLHSDSFAFDFGSVNRQEEEIYHTFTIENRGSEPLIIKRVERSCSCMKVNLSKRPIAPGESREMKVTYELRKMPPGLFSKVVQIYSNSVENTGFEQFTITGRSVNKEEE